MSFGSLFNTLRSGAAGPEQLDSLAGAAFDEGEEERALPLLYEEVRARPDARTWQWIGSLHRALDEHEPAMAAFGEAATLAPGDAAIAHGRARVALEAGLDAVPLFEAAMRLSRPTGDMLIGLAAARMAAGQGERAEAELDAVLGRSPLWIQGHLQLAQLRSMLGRPEQATQSIERALAAQPHHESLWRALFELHLMREDFAALQSAVLRAASPFALPYAAIAESELGESDAAEALFARSVEAGAPLPVWRVRHLLRGGRADEALPLIDAELEGDAALHMWPYAATAWRMAGDPRSQWLEGNPRLVAVMDLTPDLPPLDGLADRLRDLHRRAGRYLDQSVRGGTQTDGPLFSRLDPEIRAVRTAVVAAVDRYKAQLPPSDLRHPLLSQRRNRRTRFAGSWSVRLSGAGFHANHVHPQGWISSALYIALPPESPGDPPHAGWLTLGEPQAQMGIALNPFREIEPRPGQLVLFPSWMWHGTRPFAEGERLTVAFDIRPPI